MKFCKISILGMALLAGCAPEVTDWTPAESPKENRVDRAVFTYALPYAAHKGRWDVVQRRNFHKFLQDSILSPYAVRVTLEEYGGHSEKRVWAVERELLKFGVPRDLIHRNFDFVDVAYGEFHRHKKYGHKNCHYRGPRHVSGSVIVVVVERFVVMPPSCANYSQQIGKANQDYSYSNLGCPTEANLGMMVARPTDLLRGTQTGAYDGTVMAAGVNRYEADKIKAIAEVTTTVMQNPIVSVGGTPGGSSGGGAGGGGGY